MATAKKTTAKKITAKQWLDWWLDPKNGKVGIEYTDKKTGQVKTTKGFHAVTSGFNDAIAEYYGRSGKEFIDSAVNRKLVSIKPVGRGKTGRGIPGVIVYPYSATANSGDKGASILSEMGLS